MKSAGNRVLLVLVLSVVSYKDHRKSPWGVLHTSMNTGYRIKSSSVSSKILLSAKQLHGLHQITVFARNQTFPVLRSLLLWMPGDSVQMTNLLSGSFQTPETHLYF